APPVSGGFVRGAPRVGSQPRWVMPRLPNRLAPFPPRNRPYSHLLNAVLFAQSSPYTRRGASGRNVSGRLGLVKSSARQRRTGSRSRFPWALDSESHGDVGQGLPSTLPNGDSVGPALGLRAPFRLARDQYLVIPFRRRCRLDHLNKAFHSGGEFVHRKKTRDV